ncbi:ABC transporter permease [Evansella tamaricis]|uniref:ABC transporter permease n=1 Tax=Evansella tamaricis TaxID=2069301 RepID=A0ABS6JMF8_9BACI|nr:ABC transporter permease [Evansella tamaricis]MBU9714865.1 ABC transporter permease [Evansella tamaricis]
MKLNDQFQMVKKNMKKNKLRVFMTVLATTMGCAFLIVLASIGFGLQGSIMEQMTEYQSITEIRVHGKDIDGEFHPLTKEDVESINTIEDVTGVVTQDYVPGVVVTNLNEFEGYSQMLLRNLDSAETTNFSLSEGRYPEKTNEIIVGYDFKETLYEPIGDNELEEGETGNNFSGDLLNETILVQIKDYESESILYEKEFVIVGIGKESARDWLNDGSIYANIDLKEEIFTVMDEPKERLEIYDNVSVHVMDIQQNERVTKELKEMNFAVYSITEEIDRLNIFFAAFKAGLIFVGAVAVIIASIGIFNTMTMAVTERTHEIGVMKALGANPLNIRQMFLMESAFIGVIGSFFGVLISYIVSFAANIIIPLILESVTESTEIDIVFSAIPIELVLIAVAISVGVAMLSGFRPAAKATSINVLTALRREA